MECYISRPDPALEDAEFVGWIRAPAQSTAPLGGLLREPTLPNYSASFAVSDRRLDPVFNGQSPDFFELAFIIGHENRVQAQRVRGNLKIQRSNGLTSSLKVHT